jgi:hypothetical protein
LQFCPRKEAQPVLQHQRAEDKPSLREPCSEQEAEFLWLWVCCILGHAMSLKPEDIGWGLATPPQHCIQGPCGSLRPQACMLKEARFCRAHVISVLPSGDIWSLLPFYTGWGSAHPLPYPPSEGCPFPVCVGRGSTLPKSAHHSLVWAEWASLGGGEVGQLVAMVTAAAPCQPSHLLTTNLTDEILCPVWQGWGPEHVEVDLRSSSRKCLLRACLRPGSPGLG